MQQCEQFFGWSGCLVDQEFQTLLPDGMLRCYLSHDEVVGFCHQSPKGLLDATTALASTDSTTTRSLMKGPDEPAFQLLRTKVEREWVPQMMDTLDLARETLPIIWDADFLFGTKTESGGDTYVLCEINVSAVWPFPAYRVDKIAANALAQTLSLKGLRE